MLIDVNLCLEKLKTRISLIHTDLQSHHTNPQGWLPPCYLSVEVAGSVIHGHTLNRQINRKAPATPHATRPGGVRSGRAPSQSEDKRGGRRAEVWMGAGISLLLTADERG